MLASRAGGFAARPGKATYQDERRNGQNELCRCRDVRLDAEAVQ
jgi:hypothetical protein